MNLWRRFNAIYALELGDVHQFAVLIALALHWNEREAIAWPSVDTICRGTGMKERKVQRTLRALEAAGLVSAIGSTKGGRGRSVRYRLNWTPFIGAKGCTLDTLPRSIFAPAILRHPR